MRAHISIAAEGAALKPLKPVRDAGQVSIAVDYDGTTAQQIWIDAFTRGNGGQRRNYSLINIYDFRGYPVFSGTFGELVEVINHGKDINKI